MTSIGKRFDQWVNSGPFTTTDLGIFRMVYAIVVLLTMPRAMSTLNLPSAWWSTAPGPFELLDAPPPGTVVVALQVALALSLALLAVGLWTTPVSIASGILLMACDGILNSYGTINHYGLLGVVPLVVCWAGWGQHYSIDAQRTSSPHPESATPQWPLRLVALIIGIGFVTAGWPKVAGGWLDTDRQSAQGFVFGYYVRDPNPAGWMVDLVGVHARRPWELVDWMTVALELSVIVSVLSWTWFRGTLVVLVSFHVAILFLLGIAFAVNVIAYGAFVNWSLLVPDRIRRSQRKYGPRTVTIVVAVLTSIGLLVSLGVTPSQRFALSGTWVIVAAMVCVALTYRRTRSVGERSF